MRFKINPGELNKKIAIEQYTEGIDSEGYPSEGWTELYSCYAKMNNLYGKEFYNAMAVNSEKTVEFTVRYCKIIDTITTKKFRIRFNNKFFDITFVDNILYKNQWIKIKAIEVI